MADHINALIVVLDHDVRDGEVEPLVKAIMQLRGVLEVQTHVADPSDAIATFRARSELMKKLWSVLEEK